MSTFVTTDTVLDKILRHKQAEIEASKRKISQTELQAKLVDSPPVRNAVEALTKATVALIAEVKHASPSRGILIENFDPLEIGKTYNQNGASAISVLTDEEFFKGHLDYMTAVRDVVDVPVLRKDFIIDEYQILEARVAHADMILLIVAALSDTQLQDLHDVATELGMFPLVEVHNERELERALRIQPRIIGINNRDLKTFNVDLGTTERIAQEIPKDSDIILVAESGIHSVEDVQRMGKMGAQAILVGEALVVADDMAQTVQEFSSCKRF